MLVGEETPQCVRHLGAPLFRHFGGRSDEVLVDGTGEQFEPPLEELTADEDRHYAVGGWPTTERPCRSRRLEPRLDAPERFGSLLETFVVIELCKQVRPLRREASR